MKQQITKSIQATLKDRYLTVLLFSFLLVCIITVIFLLTAIHPSELQIVVHYTSYGPTNFYRDKWYYLLSFVGFVVVMAIFHGLITYKIFQKRGRELALAFVWLSILMVAIAGSLFYQVLKIASLS